MCGRYVIRKPVTSTNQIVHKNEGVDDSENFNAYPTSLLPIIKADENEIILTNFIWGLVPSWSKKMSDFKPLNNARLETVTEKITFKNLLNKNRCVIPASGYYEWKKDENNKKTPQFIYKKDNTNLYFAGLYQKNENIEFTIITREASSELKNIHSRMPVVLEEKDILKYLNTKTDFLTMINNIKPPNLDYHQVSKDVNNPDNNRENLIDQI